MWVRSGFPAHWRQGDGSGLPSLDWRAEGVDIPYVILFTGRCGSTHLASMLTETRACGEPTEYFNENNLPHFPEAATAKSLDEYVVHLARARSSNRRFGFKIDHWRWAALRALIDVERLFPIEQSRFFLMTRKDIVAQAYSFAVAKATAVWHDYADAPSLKAQDYEPGDDEIWRELTLIARSETALSRYLKWAGRPAMRLTYEQLTQDPEVTLRRVGEALALEANWLDKLTVPVSRVRKLTYTQSEEKIEGFKRSFAQELSLLDSSRENFDPKAFRRSVLNSRGMSF